MTNTHSVQVRAIDPRVGTQIPLPYYATGGAAALDLHACIDAPLVLEPGAVELIGTGLAIHIGAPDMAAVILPRSGIGHRNGIVLGNGVGLIDSDYQGEIRISCWNRGTEAFTINPGDRVAQMAFLPVARVELQQVREFTPSCRGEEGFGHTGLASGADR